MIENHNRYYRSAETKDFLETAAVLRRWKTMLLLIVAVCLIILQASFYLLDQGYFKFGRQTGDNSQATVDQAGEKSAVLQILNKWLPTEFISRITFDQLSMTINLVNTLLILAAFLYCLTLRLNLKISIHGKLGGMKHITRAFMLSLLILVLLLPWQELFGGVVFGAVFTPIELMKSYSAKTEKMFNIGLYYLRFGGYSLSVFLLLIFSELASLLWDGAVQRRLRVIEVEMKAGMGRQLDE